MLLHQRRSAVRTIPVRQLVYDTLAGLRFKSDLPKGRLILRDVLLQDLKQRLGLLGAEVDALEVVNGNVIRSNLVHPAKQKEKIPEIHAHLDAIGVVLTILGRIDQLNRGSGLLS